MRKAIIHASHKILLDHVRSRECVVRERSRKLREPIEF